MILFIFRYHQKPRVLGIKYFSNRYNEGEVKTHEFNIGFQISSVKNRIEELKENESSIPSWQKAFKETETKLIAEAKNDKLHSRYINNKPYTSNLKIILLR